MRGVFWYLRQRISVWGSTGAGLRRRWVRRREQECRGEWEEVRQEHVANSSEVLIGSPHCSLCGSVSPNPPMGYKSLESYAVLEMPVFPPQNEDM